MDYPVIFPLMIPLKHRSPDDVRQLLQTNGFQPDQQSPVHDPTSRFAGHSEIWHRLAGPGYAVVRIDTQGHAHRSDRDGNAYEIGGISPGAHGGKPHYHKEWIDANLLQNYLTGYVRQVVRYDDSGNPITAAMNDGTAAATHIPR